MKHAFAWLTALVLIMPQISTAGEHDMTQDQQDALAAIHTMTSAFQNNDIDGVMASYEAEATVVFEPDAPVSNADQLAQMFAGMAMVNPVFNYLAGHEIIVSGDIAMHIAPWSMTGRTPDGQDISQEGLSVAVLRRQMDGNWKMVIDNPHGGRLLTRGE